ncbi:hypothetical protein E2562_022134 [Oryza meyeriana var. granulata]|uniref:Uncharacterized protein n=1 Tax=Oryza meyeriana var. granulata TaxID=110450 RepID=A0A6G1BMG9_9ORYZ|nr:hypothetical protein E2562_022134 [Oryza meyeriana var. granulata]
MEKTVEELPDWMRVTDCTWTVEEAIACVFCDDNGNVIPDDEEDGGNPVGKTMPRTTNPVTLGGL